MSANLLDGKNLSSLIRSSLKKKILYQQEKGQRRPGLAVILVGNDPASTIYVKNKRLACEEVGIHSVAYDLPSETSEKALLHLIDTLNQSPEIDGILVQLPLPSAIRANKIIEAIDPKKDVDGFHPFNMGRLAQGNPTLRPCTPYGIIHLLNHYDIPLQGKEATVIGASNIVGRPMALELLHAKATVTICHRLTKELSFHIKKADIIIVATGTKDVIDPAWLQPHQVVIDVGIHRLQDGTLRGDVDFHKAKEKVNWITPVPGGIGPMTICTLLQNTLTAAGIPL